MPKTYGTRSQRARDLLGMIRKGPSYGEWQKTPEERYKTYRLWVRTWVLPELIDLIPELKKDPDVRLQAGRD